MPADSAGSAARLESGTAAGRRCPPACRWSCRSVPGEVVLGIVDTGGAGRRSTRAQPAILAQEVRSPFAGTFHAQGASLRRSDRPRVVRGRVPQAVHRASSSCFSTPTRRRRRPPGKEHVAATFVPTWADAAAPQLRAGRVDQGIRQSQRPAQLFVRPRPGRGGHRRENGRRPARTARQTAHRLVRVKQFELTFTRQAAE